jgi:hypothetical protein
MKSWKQLRRHFQRKPHQLEVEAELRFHLDMQTRDYENEGLANTEAMAKAELRFGDFNQIKNQCVEIATRSSAAAGIMKFVFGFSFLVGVFLRSLALQKNVTHVGDVLMMIGVSGGLLLMAKQMRARNSVSQTEPLRLGLQPEKQFTPVAFDENGRTPFERARGGD